ncbi:DNA/RNA non-specific endonuclease, partial [Streptomyces caniscabiei]|uniref:DNA/RNA non-specific endonuclease n=1 Tax=Streptomyces caniscabiei TaxID=2746961 RepID=UPI001C4FB6FF
DSGSRPDLSAMDQQQVDDLFDDLVKNTRQLTDSFDLSYQLTAQGSAAFTGCGPAACNVRVTVNSSFTSKNVKPPKKIDATMDVTMTGDGAPAGGCSTTGTLPVNGTGNLTCTNTSPAWTSWYARASRQRGTHIYIANARVLGRAITEADIDRLIEELHRRHEEYQRNLSPTASPSDGCTPQPATYGPLDDGRGTSGHAVLCDPPPTGSDAGVEPEGYNAAEHDAGHLIGARFGGSGTTVANVVTLYRRMNQVVMRTCENRVADLVKAEDPVDYTVTANYTPGKVIPDSITMVAKGSKGTLFSRTIPNTKSARHVCLK